MGGGSGLKKGLVALACLGVMAFASSPAWATGSGTASASASASGNGATAPSQSGAAGGGGARGATSPLRLAVCLDNSGSMIPGGKFRRAQDALLRFIASLPVPFDAMVELCMASDRVDVVLVTSLRTVADRQRLLDAVRQAQAIRATRTLFRSVDAELSVLIARDALPNERIGFVLVTDGRSDDPGDDLRAEDLGQRVIGVGRGLIAAVGGDVPMVESLAARSVSRRGGPLVPPGTSLRSGGESRMRTMLSGAPPRVMTPARVDAVPATTLFGVIEPHSVEVTVMNPATVSRRVELVTGRAPPGVRAAFVPAALDIGPGQTGRSTLQITADRRVEDSIEVWAQTPETATSPVQIPVDVQPRGWLRSNWWAPFTGALGLLALCVGFVVTGRRAHEVGVPGTELRTTLVAGERAPLSAFVARSDGAAELPADAGWLARTRRGYRVEAGSVAVVVSGRRIEPGSRGGFRLGERVEVAGHHFVVDRVSFAVAPKYAGAEGSAVAFDFAEAGGGLR